MKTSLLILFSLSISLSSLASFSSTPAIAGIKPVTKVDSSQFFPSSRLTIKELQVYLGRKLTFKEKLQWFLSKKLTPKIGPEDEVLAAKAKRNAYFGFGFAVATIIFPLFVVPGLVLSNIALGYEKKTPGILGSAKGFAKIGQILSWVFIGTYVLSIAILIIFLATL